MPRRIATLYDRGTAKHQEDFFFLGEHIAVIADGVSAPYNNEHPIEMIDGKTGGGKVASMICERFDSFGSKIDLRLRVIQINDDIGVWQVKRSLSLARADLLPGAAMVAAKFTPEKLTIAYTADAIALWRYKDGRIVATENQLWILEPKMHSVFARIMRDVDGDRVKAWEQYFPTFCEERLHNVNGTGENAFGLLNGQKALLRHLKVIDVAGSQAVTTLILCSDDLLPLPITARSAEIPPLIVRKAFELYDRGGLHAMLEWKRSWELQAEDVSHIAQGEATGIAIEF